MEDARLHYLYLYPANPHLVKKMTIKPEEVTDAVVQELAAEWGLSPEDFGNKGATLTSLRNFEDHDMRTKIAAHLQ